MIAAPIRLAIGGALCLAAAMGIGRFVYTPILPFMVENVPLAPSQAGLIAAANFLGYLVGALAGSFGHLPGSKRNWMLGALFASAVTSAAMALGSGLVVFCLLRFLGGFASAFVLVFASSLVLEDLARAGRANLSALYFSGVGCGIALSAVLIAALSHSAVGWQGLWLASAGTTLLLLLASALLVIKEAPPEVSSSQTAAAQTEVETRQPAALYRLIAAYALFGFGYVITMTFISVIVREDPALSGLEEIVWLVVGLAAAPSILFWNKIASRTSASMAFSIACIAEALGVALSVSGGGAMIILLSAALVGATFMGITALGLMEARKLSTGDPRRILAIMTASFGLGQVIGPWLAGYLHDMTGSFQSASFAAAISLIIAAGLSFRRKAR
ncbi:YbfB/YjiJ family MFS transporter [Roseibium algae]|uniref:YbfB/YjiJ family MFS transporter n=1 Tax=Roseibium algae TaxID=3123038 RepID=A0ABU8TI97_9HYPH